MTSSNDGPFQSKEFSQASVAAHKKVTSLRKSLETMRRNHARDVTQGCPFWTPTTVEEYLRLDPDAVELLGEGYVSADTLEPLDRDSRTPLPSHLLEKVKKDVEHRKQEFLSQDANEYLAKYISNLADAELQADLIDRLGVATCAIQNGQSPMVALEIAAELFNGIRTWKPRK